MAFMAQVGTVGLSLAVTAGSAVVIVLEYLGERDKARRRINALAEMQCVTFDPPATHAERVALRKALKQQQDWLNRWHVLPWAPTPPYADLPIDKQHKLLFMALQ